MALACLLPVTAFLSTSCLYIGEHGDERVRFEKEVPLSAPLQPGSSFSAATPDGSITVHGLDTTECKVLAKVVTHARTQEDAEELAQQIDVKLAPADGGLKVVIDKPPVIHNASFSVSLDVDLPGRTSLALETSDGAVHIANITGTVDAKTSDGSIEAEGLNGDVKLRTSDGTISCSRIDAKTLHLRTSDGSIKLTQATLGAGEVETSDGGITLGEVHGDSLDLRTSDGSIRCHDIAAGRATCRTSDGNVEVEFSPDTPKALNLTATTSNGSITFKAPPGLSATIEANTDEGSIRTSLPITIQGKVGKSLHGTIGDGEGKVYLKTTDGSITIR
jgi:DUF4097 and DUF4098 domain-containing protein YvlB